MLDLLLAIAHHLLIFGIFGVLLAEMLKVRTGMTLQDTDSVAAIDRWYGILAGLILIVGFSRAVYATKGWDYYSHNGLFWAKIVTFAIVGLLSVPPTIVFIRCRRAGTPPSDTQIASVRRYLHLETALFPLLLVFAAAMARGYGQFWPS